MIADILVLGAVLFNAPVNGGFGGTLTLDLFASTLAQPQMQAFQMPFLLLLPSILLSGFVVPFEACRASLNG